VLLDWTVSSPQESSISYFSLRKVVNPCYNVAGLSRGHDAMNRRNSMNRTTITGAIMLVTLSSAEAADLGSRPASWEPRVAVAKYQSPVGNLLVNEQPGQPWRTLATRADIHSRDLLLALPGTRAKIETSPRGVELTLWGNLPKLSDFYGLQSAVILHDSRAFDLDFTLRRGRVLVTNRKESGPARVWLRIEGAAFQLTLGEPGDTVCVGLSSYWPRGVPFKLSSRPEEGSARTPSSPSSSSPKVEDDPTRTLNFQVVKGQVDVRVSGAQYALSAPPGLAAYHWDSVNGSDPTPRQRRQLEAWADPNHEPPASAKPFLYALSQYEAAVKDREPRTALFDLLDAAVKAEDRDQARGMAEFAVLGLAAINDIERVLQALEDPRHATVRHAAVLALRHWIGDEAGRDRLLYRFLIDPLRYAKAQAATVLQLLHSALASEEPDTYDLLIAYLQHEKLAIRELAWWHLSRLVPEEMLVPYDPASSSAVRAKAAAAWKQLIPSGSLPARKPKK
jgi:hypothetical protein